MMKGFNDSFRRWSDAIRVLNFTETTYADANIKIGFYNETVGPEVVRGHPYRIETR